MKRCLLCSVLVSTLTTLALGEQPWQRLSDPAEAEVAAHFQSPPPEYGMTFYWGWDGPVTEEVIARDLTSTRPPMSPASPSKPAIA
jgi:hypothetical protein